MADNPEAPTEPTREHPIPDPFAAPADAPSPADARSPGVVPTRTPSMAHDLTTPGTQSGGAANTPTPTATAGLSAIPSEAHASSANGNPVRPGGAPARVYMNEKIVPYLLEGMKMVTKEQPANPLRVLGEFLIQKSNEVEGGQGQGQPGKESE